MDVFKHKTEGYKVVVIDIINNWEDEKDFYLFCRLNRNSKRVWERKRFHSHFEFLQHL